MPRGMVQSLHHIHFNSWKTLGFTLLELIITVAIIAILVSAAAPSFSNLIDSNKVKRLATEIEWLLVQAKSEAVMRNEELKVYFVRDDSGELTYQDDGDWVLVVTLKAAVITDRASAKNAALALIDGQDFKRISIKASNNYVSYTIDPVRATPSNSGSYWLYIDSSQDVKVMINQLTGRVRTCGETGEYYGYKSCS
ncbi:prepilin-type N-terminal cleavage/methylation domain-containing protein [Photobacterium frigidiphilum]|uniref:pilus assembly FimT family protein n=1 Tax=Photobacterium frigidiphilum TaxID=264736 RepID=UPI003D099D05